MNSIGTVPGTRGGFVDSESSRSIANTDPGAEGRYFVLDGSGFTDMADMVSTGHG